MKPNARLTYLLERLVSHNATAEELDELSALVDRDVADASIDDTESWLEVHVNQQLPAYNPQQWRQVADQILRSDKLPADPVAPPATRVHYLHKWWWAVAAVVLIAAGAMYLNRNNPRPVRQMVRNASLDVAPGQTGAMLTLADGSQLVLDSTGNGVITRQNGTSVAMQNGDLQYTPGQALAGPVQYNTISTAKGRQFTITLSDGTKVWLNASSSLRFPVAFNGSDRTVEFTGEGYFEVAANARQPFRVHVPDQISLEVLGTAFNINAYTNDRNSYTTLVNGGVKISPAGKTSGAVVLKPGEQLLVTGSHFDVMSNANVEQAIAWKNGFFNFDSVSLKDMMRQLERWYDLEVVYEGNVPDIMFFGEMSRNLKLSDVLNGLERSNVHFRLEEGRKLIVMP
ncbi:FecR family protein [Chitinophaga pinensis]|uniref:Anti-FecI sigma factor, FecR n=1 Tax=Chitinophaga pinensis (strain ATCC 43595 / DSM 2588 / LMG 13176 / NBRC 15968 / NCIMB 11800 / UQM 2034) TaxID=485918 RepID=A0A979GUI1_CHIPD|nr:FecR family protein [Chitinophaga pinensis]ACU60426.1 anti-FecI sigma factor, FecR [Chitinophaga pinensis DSM 2588]